MYKLEAGMKYCQHCGNIIDDNVAVCPHCKSGTPHREEQGIAIAAFVLTFTPFLFIAFLLGCIGIKLYKNKTYRGMCLVAIVLPLSIIGILVLAGIIIGLMGVIANI